MLPIRRALKPPVEWVSPCPLAAAISGAGATTSLGLGVKASKCFTAQQSDAAYSPALGARPSPILGLHHAKMHNPLHGALGPCFSLLRGGDLEIVGGVVRRPAHCDK